MKFSWMLINSFGKVISRDYFKLRNVYNSVILFLSDN